MDMSEVAEWLKTIWVWLKKLGSNPAAGIQNQNSPISGNQTYAPITAKDNAKVTLKIGDTHYHGYSLEDAMKLGEKLAAEKGEKDTQLIKSLQETIQALTQQNAKKYDIKQAFDLLVQGDTSNAEEIFVGIAEEAEHKGKEKYIEAAEALRHVGSLAFLHDTQKAFKAYKRSTELDPVNWDGWNSLGLLYFRIGKFGDAENAFETILKIPESNKEAQAVAYGNLGIIYRTRGDLDRSVEYHEKALVLNKELVRIQGMAGDYCNLGIIYGTRGDLERSIKYIEAALVLSRGLADKDGMANCYGNLGHVYLIRGDLDRAIEYSEKALAMKRELGDKNGIASCYGNLGYVYYKQGNLDRAVECHEKALVIDKELGNKEGISSDYGNLGLVYQTRGDLDLAVEYHEKALALNREMGRKKGMAIQHSNLGRIYRIRGKLDKAVEHYQKSLTLYTEVGMKPEMVKAQSLLDEARQDNAKSADNP